MLGGNAAAVPGRIGGSTSKWKMWVTQKPSSVSISPAIKTVSSQLTAFGDTQQMQGFVMWRQAIEEYLPIRPRTNLMKVSHNRDTAGVMCRCWGGCRLLLVPVTTGSHVIPRSIYRARSSRRKCKLFFSTTGNSQLSSSISVCTVHQNFVVDEFSCRHLQSAMSCLQLYYLCACSPAWNVVV
jgi:hypothetical protein